MMGRRVRILRPGDSGGGSITVSTESFQYAIVLLVKVRKCHFVPRVLFNGLSLSLQEDSSGSDDKEAGTDGDTEYEEGMETDEVGDVDDGLVLDKNSEEVELPEKEEDRPSLMVKTADELFESDLSRA